MQVYTYPEKRWAKAKERTSDSIEMSYFIRTNPTILEAANSLSGGRENQQQQDDSLVATSTRINGSRIVCAWNAL